MTGGPYPCALMPDEPARHRVPCAHAEPTEHDAAPADLYPEPLPTTSAEAEHAAALRRAATPPAVDDGRPPVTIGGWTVPANLADATAPSTLF